VTLDLGNTELERRLRVRLDPRLRNVTSDQLEAQQKLALMLRDAVSEANRTVLAIRKLRDELSRGSSSGELAPAKQQLLDKLSAIESTLYQTRNKSPKDKIAHPIMLNDRLAHLMDLVGMGAGPPTQAQLQVYGELSAELNAALARYRAVLANELEAYNRQLMFRRRGANDGKLPSAAHPPEVVLRTAEW